MDTRSKLGASKSRPRWAAHTRIGNVWEYPPPPGLQAPRFFKRDSKGGLGYRKLKEVLFFFGVQPFLSDLILENSV